MNTPTVPPSLDDIRRLLGPRMAAIPQVLADWPAGEGPLADVPLLDLGEIAPKTFTELAGTVRVAATGPTLVTVAAMLEIPGGSGLVLATMALSSHDLGPVAEEKKSRQTLALVGARKEQIPVEVAALLGPLQDSAGPAAGVGVVRPLVFADPDGFPHPEDTTHYEEELCHAVRAAVSEDREAVSDLGGAPLSPLPADLARIWSPIFEVVRTATAGLAMRAAGRNG